MTVAESVHPKPRCDFGRAHDLAGFVAVAGRYACFTCGVIDDDSWYDDAGQYVGPAEAIFVDRATPGWLLRDGPYFYASGQSASPAPHA